jgi:hypothetical protein
VGDTAGVRHAGGPFITLTMKHASASVSTSVQCSTKTPNIV